MSKTYVSKSLRQTVAAQAKYRCGYCLTQELNTGMPMEIDHLIPEALDGRTEETNLWLACNLCNSIKNNRINTLDPLTGELTSLFNPRSQIWSEHFAWVLDGELMVGITPTGRATVEALNLNRQPLVEARKRWIGVGWHPSKD